jgi:hypothetical protein
MRGTKTTRLTGARGSIFALICVSMLAASCSKSEPAAEKAEVTFDVSRLPRVTGAKEIFANLATTIFTSPSPVAQTADMLDKTLAASGWQKYGPPNSATSDDAAQRIMSFKKGQQALGVFITIAPAQGNATSVQYTAVALKTDLPFTKDASDIEYSPDRPLLSLITAEPIDKTLDFYRKELAARGWALWSVKTNGKQPDGGPSGTVHEKGAYAHYITDKDPSVALVLTLQKAEPGKFKVEIKEYPVGILADLRRAYVDSDNHGTPLADVGKLPRLEGAQEVATRSTADRPVYTVAGTLADTTDALKRLLAAEGWKPYVAPLDEPHTLSPDFKKGGQGLSVSFTIQHGTDERTSQQTTVSYSPARLYFALAAPDDATDMVFDQNRPYLNLNTAGTVDATRDFYNKQLIASGWMPLSAADAAANWPNAKLDGALAYYDRGNKRPIVLSLQRNGEKTNVEIKIAPFALPQTLEVGQEDFGFPAPKGSVTSGGRGGSIEQEVHAHVPAEVGTVLAFYRSELGARKWKEETQGAVLNPDEVMLNFSSEDNGSAVLKLAHKYDLTTVSLVHRLPKPAVKAETAARTEPSGNDSIDAMMKQAQQMVRDATADAIGKMNVPKPVQPANGPNEALGPLAGSDVPVPLPAIAEDIDFGNGRLEFTAATDVRMVADFYRTTMKQQGWQAQSSVINNANMVVLNFTKAGKSVSFTVMKMGDKTNVTADGSALNAAAKAAKTDTKADTAPSDKAPTDAASVPATADDLIVEDSGGLPVPKRHTLAVGDKSPFRRELNANVPLDLATVLEFYRRELGKLNWNEEKGAVTAVDKAVIAYRSTEGPGQLKLSRKDGETIVNLTTRNPDAATKAGIAAKPGQAKLLISNPNEVDAVLTINKQIIKAAAGAGMKGPDGPTLELAPGKYKFTIKLPEKPASEDELAIGADETWGLLIGPGGALPMHVY